MKKERGSITIITIVTVLFIVSFLISTFVIIENRRQAQLEIKRETKAIYEKDIGKEETIYEELIAKIDTQILYQQVEYIASTGSQYIDLGIKGNLNTKVEIDFKINTPNKSQWIFGARGASSSDRQYNFVIGSDYNFATPLSAQSNATTFMINNAKVAHDTNRHLFVKEYTSPDIMGTFDNQIVKTQNNLATITAFTTPNNLLLFNSNNNGSATNSGANMNCYSFKLWDDGTLERNLVPCYSKLTGEIGMYDLVNGVFYTNSGTGEFETGPEV